MSAWGDDDVPALPPRLDVAMDYERGRVREGEQNAPEASTGVDSAEVLGSNPVSLHMFRTHWIDLPSSIEAR
jgi:hypothetical protein